MCVVLPGPITRTSCDLPGIDILAGLDGIHERRLDVAQHFLLPLVTIRCTCE